MNSEVKESTRIIKVINEHLAEQPDCKHDLKTFDRFTIEKKQHWRDEQARRRESTWR